PGLQKLFNKLNIDTKYLVEDDITFMITPRLNAASRMDSPRRAFELLAVTDEAEAGALADHLSKINDERKILVALTMKEIKQTLSKREEKSVIVIGNPKWRVGVLGLIASKIAEEYKRPAFVWGMEGGETIKGSCRSDGSVNLVEMMGLLPENTLLGFGGHELAGGFSVSHEQVHFLSENLEIVYEKTKREFTQGGNYSVDKTMTLDQVSSENYKVIEKMAPFGLGNPKPTFLFENVEIFSIKRFGKANDHLEISFKDENNSLIKAIQFFKTEESFNQPLKVGNRINLVANFEKSMFRGRTELRLRIVDIM
ncbi:MAG TPA: DHHA1 domain-containing protein, partial [Candidatus Paceibacterota bacterium]